MRTALLLLIPLLLIPMGGAQAAPLAAEALQPLLSRLDDRQRHPGDYKALIYMDQHKKGEEDLVYEAVIYRRDAEDRFMMLFSRPRTEAGKGYLKIDRNLWLYDPGVGKWERRTDREGLGGTGSKKSDFDPPRFANDFEHTYVAEEKLGRFAVHHLRLKARKGVEISYPNVDLWIDQATENVLKVQERALSGKLIRTVYYPKWKKVYSEAKKADIYYPKEIRAFDEVETGSRTTVVFKRIDLNPLPANLFTKAWLESQSR